jgi:hypothetical protein
MSRDIEARVVEIAINVSGVHRANASSAIDQDMRISGGDVSDLIEALHMEFGDVVLTIPWHRFSILSEGLPLSFPLILTWQLLTWPFRGRFELKNPLERLTLGHIATVISAGKWIEPEVMAA